MTPRPSGNSLPPRAEVERDLPLARRLVLEAEHEDGEGLQGKGPDDAEGVGLAQDIDVPPRSDDRDELQEHDQVDDAVGGAVAPVGRPEPVGQHPVFADPLSTPLEPMMAVLTAPDSIRKPTITTKPWKRSFKRHRARRGSWRSR